MGKNNKKFTYEYVYDYYKERDCQLLEKEYINSKTQMNYICKCGTKRCTTFGKFRNQKHGCRVCQGLERYTQEEIEKVFSDNNCKLISEYTGANDILKYICECGNKSNTTLSNFKKGKRCYECGLNKLASHFKHDVFYVKEFFFKNNCIPLFDEYVNCHTPLDYVCECGNEAKITFSDFQNGQRCMECRVIRIQRTMYSNGTQQCSSQQKHIHNLIGGVLNYPLNTSTLDIAFPEEKLYIEYDGGGHDLSVKLGSLTEDEFNKKEKNRRYALYKLGWKEIKIISRKDYLPSNDMLLEIFNFSYQYFKSGHSWVVFDIDNKIVKSSQFNKSFNYGQLKKLNNAS